MTNLDLDLDDHLVAHDAVIFGTAFLAWATGGLAGQPQMVAVTMATAVAALGVGAMRVGPTRRGINRMVLAADRVVRR